VPTEAERDDPGRKVKTSTSGGESGRGTAGKRRVYLRRVGEACPRVGHKGPSSRNRKKKTEPAEKKAAGREGQNDGRGGRGGMSLSNAYLKPGKAQEGGGLTNLVEVRG